MLSLSNSAYKMLKSSMLSSYHYYLVFSNSESHSVTSVNVYYVMYCLIKTVSMLSLSN